MVTIKIAEMDDQYLGQFYPDEMKIFISNKIRLDYPNGWRRVIISILAHELTHLYEWIFICKCNSDTFFNMPDPERRAGKIETIVLRLLGLQWED